MFLRHDLKAFQNKIVKNNDTFSLFFLLLFFKLIKVIQVFNIQINILECHGMECFSQKVSINKLIIY